MKQLHLFPNTDLQEAFEEFDAEHPEVWTYFERFTFEAIRANPNKVGAKMVWERMRWHCLIEHAEKFKLNNNYTAYYARKFMAKHPQHDGIFETRKVRK